MVLQPHIWPLQALWRAITWTLMDLGSRIPDRGPVWIKGIMEYTIMNPDMPILRVLIPWMVWMEIRGRMEAIINRMVLLLMVLTTRMVWTWPIIGNTVEVLLNFTRNHWVFIINNPELRWSILHQIKRPILDFIIIQILFGRLKFYLKYTWTHLIITLAQKSTFYPKIPLKCHFFHVGF